MEGDGIGPIVLYKQGVLHIQSLDIFGESICLYESLAALAVKDRLEVFNRAGLYVLIQFI